MKIQVEIKQHPTYPATHVIAIVTTSKGNVFACTYAEDESGFPNEAKVRADWKQDRKSFEPFNTSVGQFC